MRGKLGFAAIIVILLIICSTCGSNSDSTYKIVLDPGHGGEDVGAIGASGLYEKDFNLSVAAKVKKLLEKDERIEVYLTREDDRYLALENRHSADFAKDVDGFISIHGNAFVESHVSGTETFYNRRNSRTFARIIHNHVVEATGFNDRNVQKEDFYVLKKNKVPAVLLELGFLSNSEEESIMFTEQFQDRVAEAIVAGIEEYLFDS